MVVQFLFLLILVCAGDEISAKDASLKQSAKSHSQKQVLRKEKLSAVLRHKIQIKNLKLRNWPQRCSIICPIALPETCTNNGPKYPAVVSTTAASRSSTEETELPSTTTELPDDFTESNDTIVSPGNTATNASRNLGRKSRIYDHLTPRQKHLLIKRLHLGNRHGKKLYRFREINPYQCRVICDEYYEDTSQPQQSFSDEEEESSDDNYEEGEDTPIEITIRPAEPPSGVLAGIKPFGLVDFIGLDDFGPSGELAQDPDEIFEEKSSIRKNVKKVLKKNRAVAKRKKHIH